MAMNKDFLGELAKANRQVVIETVGGIQHVNYDLEASPVTHNVTKVPGLVILALELDPGALEITGSPWEREMLNMTNYLQANATNRQAQITYEQVRELIQMSFQCWAVARSLNALYMALTQGIDTDLNGIDTADVGSAAQAVETLCTALPVLPFFQDVLDKYIGIVPLEDPQGTTFITWISKFTLTTGSVITMALSNSSIATAVQQLEANILVKQASWANVAGLMMSGVDNIFYDPNTSDITLDDLRQLTLNMRWTINSSRYGTLEETTSGLGSYYSPVGDKEISTLAAVLLPQVMQPVISSAPAAPLISLYMIYRMKDASFTVEGFSGVLLNQEDADTVAMLSPYGLLAAYQITVGSSDKISIPCQPRYTNATILDTRGVYTLINSIVQQSFRPPLRAEWDRLATVKHAQARYRARR